MGIHDNPLDTIGAVLGDVDDEVDEADMRRGAQDLGFVHVYMKGRRCMLTIHVKAGRGLRRPHRSGQ